MIYLTYNDAPSGIYSGQVIEVCRFLSKDLNANIRLVSLISLRGFSGNRKKIKSEMPDALVLPMFPGVQNWSVNILWLILAFLFWGKLPIFARGPFAASLALRMKKLGMATKVCFDARGAYSAEFREYNVAGNTTINEAIFSIEKNVLMKSDFRLAVSEKLVSYWTYTFGYRGKPHVVIPCTVSSGISESWFDPNKISVQRTAIGFNDEDIVLVYSGSSAGWQSIGLLDDFLTTQMRTDPKVKALFLTDKLPAEMKVLKEFPDRVVHKWVQADQVAQMLCICDHGLLIREPSVTNQVSSPVKFAEYLAAGLPVIISEGIGDYPAFVREQACGTVVGPADKKYALEKVSPETKNKIRSLALKYFSKTGHIDSYKKILAVIK